MLVQAANQLGILFHPFEESISTSISRSGFLPNQIIGQNILIRASLFFYTLHSSSQLSSSSPSPCLVHWPSHSRSVVRNLEEFSEHCPCFTLSCGTFLLPPHTFEGLVYSVLLQRCSRFNLNWLIQVNAENLWHRIAGAEQRKAPGKVME